MNNNIRNPKDHDFIRTEENYLFCVIGYLHPEDRVISYLKYVPNITGKWKLNISESKDNGKKRTIPLMRVLNHYSAEQVLKSYDILLYDYLKYVYDCPISKIKITAVPHEAIKEYYKPQERIESLYNLHNQNKLDKLQRKTIEFIDFLSENSQIKASNFGVTGSILTNTHNITFSDIDLTVHGRMNSQVIENIVLELFEGNNNEISRLNPKEAEDWRKNKMNYFNFNKAQAKLLYKRKWNMGNFRGTRFSLHPIRTDEEILKKYGDLEFNPKGIVEIEGIVTQDEDSMFLPCKFDISDVKILKGPKVDDIIQICSYEGLYCSMVRKGEFFKAKGKLEEVIDKKRKKVYHRLLIGSYLAKSQDYLLPILN
jgi:predicted nucleotidyltransferase